MNEIWKMKIQSALPFRVIESRSHRIRAPSHLNDFVSFASWRTIFNCSNRKQHRKLSDVALVGHRNEYFSLSNMSTSVVLSAKLENNHKVLRFRVPANEITDKLTPHTFMCFRRSEMECFLPVMLNRRFLSNYLWPKTCPIMQKEKYLAN